MTNSPEKASTPVQLCQDLPPPPPPPQRPRPVEQRQPEFEEYINTLIRARWLILGCTTAALLVGFAYLMIATPIYEADALVQVENKKATIAGLEDLSNVLSSESPADTELEILRSRSLAGSVVDELRLEIVAEPVYFPFFGRGMARRYLSSQPARPFLGMSSYAWGGEKIAVEQLEVPAEWAGRSLTLVARAAGKYDLLDPAGKLLAKGQAGKRLDAGGVYLLVTNLVAREGTRFRLTNVSRTDVVESLQSDLAVGEKGKKTGIIRISLQGPDPVRISQIVGSIARTYVRQNVERKSEEAVKTLRFITEQLPQVKANVDAAEAALNQYRQQRSGAVDLSMETRAALDRATEIERLLTQSQMQRAEMQQRFMPNHPAFEALTHKTAQLQSERAALEAQLKSLPEKELQAARLTRDVKVASDLYVLLLNKSQELQVVKSGTVGNVRTIDLPSPPSRPVKPTPRQTVLISLVLGLSLGVGLAFAGRALDKSVDDPEEIEQQTGFPVVATIPHSTAQRSSAAEGKVDILARAHPDDLAIEAVRSLRTSLQVAQSDTRNNVIVVCGPSPGIGKSFIAVNLAHVASAAGKRVLLVDADLRKGQLHGSFGISKAPGLSDLIRGTALPKDAIKPTSSENLYFVPAGTRPMNPSELLSSSSFQEIVRSMMHDFDTVIIDTPPILAVTDAVIAGRLAGTNLLVLRAEHHAMREIKLAVRRLEQNAIMPRAIVLNDVKPRASGYARYHYHYEYK